MSSPPRATPPDRAPGRVLVTGGAGFIGSALVRELLTAGAEVLCVDDLSAGRLERLPEHPALSFERADVEQPGALTGVLAASGPFDVLVHLAARVGVRAVLRDPEACRAANLAGARELARAVRAVPSDERPRLFAASSSEVYLEARRPLREDDPTRPLEARGRWAYAASKLAGERVLDTAVEWPAGGGPLHLRFFNVVGPGQDSAGGMVLPTFVECALAGQAVPVHGDGEQVRTLAHVDEVARALARLVTLPAAPAGPVHVGGRARTTVLELARAVVRLAGGPAGIELVDPRARCGREFEEVRWRVPDLARLAGMGIEPPSMDLQAIVADALARHARLRPWDRGRFPATADTAGGPACASPAS